MPGPAQSPRSLAEELLALGAATAGEAGATPMQARIRAAWPGARLSGSVLTVRCSPGDNLAIHVAVSSAPAATVLVVSVGDDEERGYWGEVLTTAALARGLAGLVVQGGVRDVSAVASLGFPVFATMTALGGTAKSGGGEVGAPVEVGGVRVCTGDWVVGDADGVVVVERDALERVTERARARAEKERRLFVELRAGRTTTELLGLDASAVEVT
ncbi:MAG TPA: RraA family protein [Acidimicrobiales bacterium]|nr:RraA family protein [Acidimicrobiales bacterium]